MTSQEEFENEMRLALDKMGRQVSTIRSLVAESKLNPDKAKYAESVIGLDFCLREARGLVALGNLNNAAYSFAQGRVFLDNIAAYAFQIGQREIFDISSRRYQTHMNAICGSLSGEEDWGFAE